MTVTTTQPARTARTARRSAATALALSAVVPALFALAGPASAFYPGPIVRPAPSSHVCVSTPQVKGTHHKSVRVCRRIHHDGPTR